MMQSINSNDATLTSVMSVVEHHHCLRFENGEKELVLERAKSLLSKLREEMTGSGESIYGFYTRTTEFDSLALSGEKIPAIGIIENLCIRQACKENLTENKYSDLSNNYLFPTSSISTSWWEQISSPQTLININNFSGMVEHLEL